MPHNTFYTQSGAKLIRFSNLHKIYCNFFLVLSYFLYSIRWILCTWRLLVRLVRLGG